VTFYGNTATPNPNPVAVAAVDADGKPTGDVTINMLNHFFTVTVTDPTTGQTGRYDQGTGLSSDVDVRAYVLLHEPGHLTGKLGDDRKDQALSDKFNVQIMQNCFGNKDFKFPDQ